MAVYNEILVGRFNRQIQKLFGVKGPPPIPQLASEIIPVFPIFNGNENRFPESWMLYAKGTQIGPVAAQFSFVQLRNPLNSGVIAVIEKLSISENTTDTVLLSITNAAQVDAGVLNVFGIDSRNTGSSSLIFSATSQVAGPQFGNGILWEVNLAINTIADYILDSIHELPILPGLTVRINGTVVNQALNVSIKWRERPIEDSEKTG